ncbi:hypothetical protein H0H93_014169 [Arthromyces matolae]|nr:hypothetical protein H0H93_014169 [Arthromyces matolae]
MNVSTVKAEVKAWERSFKADNGREPNVQDIKDFPEIAAKYKLYKKLAKTTPICSAGSSSLQKTPTTPPKPTPHPHHLTQPRLLEITAPLTSFNPFSPEKNKSKGKASQAQPFATKFKSPFKPKPKAPFHDPFPVLDFSKPSTSSQTPPDSPSIASDPVIKARKRLRGDPVSPSPNKDKRRRVGSQSGLLLMKNSPEDSDDDESPEIKALFISDSPVKAPSGAKSFKLLFEEVDGAKDISFSGRPTIGRKRAPSALRGLFGEASAALSDEDSVEEFNSKIQRGLFKPPPPVVDSEPTQRVRNPNVLSSKPAKRSLIDSETEDFDASQISLPDGAVLIPPSPPPTNPFANRPNHPVKEKAKANSSRKKARILDSGLLGDENPDDFDETHTSVKVIHRTTLRSMFHSITDDEGSDLHSEFGFLHDGAPRTHRDRDVELNERGDELEIHLPDRLRHVLAIDSTESRTRFLREERMVKQLVLGQRLDHYDPSKGGEIWDVGENDINVSDEQEKWVDDEDEDDWEGEPVAWAVGEL